MAGKFGYKLNPETLLYEIEKVSAKSRIWHGFFFLLWSLVLAAAVWWFYVAVLGMELPKTLLLRKQNADWTSRLEQMNKRLDALEASLAGVEAHRRCCARQCCVWIVLQRRPMCRACLLTMSVQYRKEPATWPPAYL